MTHPPRRRPRRRSPPRLHHRRIQLSPSLACILHKKRPLSPFFPPRFRSQDILPD